MTIVLKMSPNTLYAISLSSKLSSLQQQPLLPSPLYMFEELSPQWQLPFAFPVSGGKTPRWGEDVGKRQGGPAMPLCVSNRLC